MEREREGEGKKGKRPESIKSHLQLAQQKSLVFGSRSQYSLSSPSTFEVLFLLLLLFTLIVITRIYFRPKRLCESRRRKKIAHSISSIISGFFFFLPPRLRLRLLSPSLSTRKEKELLVVELLGLARSFKQYSVGHLLILLFFNRWSLENLASHLLWLALPIGPRGVTICTCSLQPKKSVKERERDPCPSIASYFDLLGSSARNSELLLLQWIV